MEVTPLQWATLVQVGLDVCLCQKLPLTHVMSFCSHVDPATRVCSALLLLIAAPLLLLCPAFVLPGLMQSWQGADLWQLWLCKVSQLARYFGIAKWCVCSRHNLHPTYGLTKS